MLVKYYHVNSGFDMSRINRHSIIVKIIAFIHIRFSEMTPEETNKVLSKQITVLIDEIRVMVCDDTFAALRLKMKWRRIFADAKKLKELTDNLTKN